MKRFFLFISVFSLCIGLNVNAQTIPMARPDQKAQSTQKTPVNQVPQTIQKAQNDPKALAVLNKASEAYNKAGGVKAGFTIKVLAKGGTEKDNISGNIHLKGSKFKLETGDMTTWFDGTNQWVHLQSNNEVNLSKPNSKELLMINPVNVFQLYKHGYNSKLLTDKSDKGKKLYQVELKPYTKESVQSIIAAFDKSTFRPVNIVITNKDKSGSRISIGSYLTGQTYAESMFTFQPKDYPDTEVIDLR
jgi:outer membrane lipoprotein-sorting protein